MNRLLGAVLALAACVVFAAPPTPDVSGEEKSLFDGANRTLAEQSFSRACDQFNEYVKRFPSGVLVREAKVKRAQACIRQGREYQRSMDELHQIANGGTVDFPSALANLALVERGDNYLPNNRLGRQAVALEQFEQVAKSSGGRWAAEARAQFFRNALNQMEQSSWDRKQTEALFDRIARLEPNVQDKARAQLIRARSWVRSGDAQLIARAEEELQSIGAGKSELADDALFELGQLYAQRSDFPKALSQYEQILKSFNGTTSNVYDQARTQIDAIKRPVLQTNIAFLELPGEKPELSLTARNLSDVSLTLHRTNPLKSSAETLLGHKSGACSDQGEPGEVVKQWHITPTVEKPYTYFSNNTRLDVPGPGVYVLEATGGAEHSCAVAIVTPNAAALKVSRSGAVVFVADAMSGVAVKGAKVAVAAEFYGRNDRQRFDAVTDDDGVARVSFGSKERVTTVVAWAESDGAFTFARGYGNGYWDTNQEYLAYIVTDRPLYKPGEKVGGKLFIRSRSDGPSVPAEKQVELKIYDPQSREVKSLVLTTNAFGTAPFELQLGKDAALGQYAMYVQANSWSVQLRHNTFRVEEYKPPEFTVKVEPVGAPKPGELVKVKVTASRYSGGPVANANGRAIVTERAYAHVWKRWDDDLDVNESYYGYYNRDEYAYRASLGYAYSQKTLTFKTSADGTAELELPKATVVGDRSYEVQVFVTDATRREVTGSGTINVATAPYYVDVRADRFLYKPGESVKVRLRSEDANGRVQSPQLEVRLARVNADGTTSAILKRTVQLTNGVAEASLDGDAVGAVRILVRKPDSAESEPPLAAADVWLTNDAKPLIPPNSGFELYTDRAPLKVGGTVRALLVTPLAGGHTLVTVEGEELDFAKAYAMNGRARFVEIPLDSAMTPNAWISITRFEGTRPFMRQAPIRVQGGDTVLDVNVTHSAEVVEPGTPQKVTVAWKGVNFDGPTEVAVTSVDESLFAIEDQALDFVTWFGRRPQQLRVTTAMTQSQRSFRPPKQGNDDQQLALQKPGVPDDLDRAGGGMEVEKGKVAAAPPAESVADVAESRASKKEMAAPARDKALANAGPMGAPGNGGEAPVKVRTNFSSSAGWFARLNAKGTSTTVDLNVPDSLSRFRTVAWVVSQGAHFGMGSNSFRTEKPLMVRLEAPRFFTERDEVTLSALVSNRLGTSASVKVEFNAPGLKPLDRTSRVVDVPANGDVRVDARYVVVEPGMINVQVVARGGGKSDAVAMPLPAVVHGSAQRVAFSGRLSDSSTMTVNVPALRNPSGTKFQLTVSPSLLSVMVDGLPYLAEYPYGCVEQTLSRFVPAAIAARTAKQLGLPASRIPSELPQMIDAGLSRLYGFQHGDGGWGWWQSDDTNRWMTAYTVYGLSLAGSAGVAVDRSVIERGRGYLVAHLGAALSNPEEHAFMVFALSSSGTVPKPALDKAFERRTKLSRRGRGMLALAMLNAHDSRARIAVENLDDILTAAKERADASVGDANDSWSTSEAIEATAYTLMAIARFDPSSANLKPLTDFLVLRRNGGKWRTTRDTAFAIYALSELALKEKASATSGTIIVEVNGREAGRVKYSNGGLTMSAPIVLGDSSFKAGSNSIVLKRDGGPITGYFAAMFDVYNRDENVKGVGSDVKVSRTYTLIGRPSSEKMTAPTEYGMPVESGVRVRVDLELRANKAMQFLMIEDLKPAGFEAVAQKSGRELCGYTCAQAELRTDRVAFFFSDIKVGVTKVSYELRAEVPGRFHALPARAEAMYAPELQATTDEMRFEVRDAPEAGDQGVAREEQ
ncbi:MAG: MG2 domain-containing protein [Myxococcaceae bacterium]